MHFGTLGPRAAAAARASFQPEAENRNLSISDYYKTPMPKLQGSIFCFSERPTEFKRGTNSGGVLSEIYGGVLSENHGVVLSGAHGGVLSETRGNLQRNRMRRCQACTLTTR